MTYNRPELLAEPTTTCGLLVLAGQSPRRDGPPRHNHLRRLDHGQDMSGHWKTWIVSGWDLTTAVTGDCGSPKMRLPGMCDGRIHRHL